MSAGLIMPDVKEIRIMYVLENVEGRCDICTLKNPACQVLDYVDKIQCELRKPDFERDTRLNCPIGVIVINGKIFREIKPSDIRDDLI